MPKYETAYNHINHHHHHTTTHNYQQTLDKKESTPTQTHRTGLPQFHTANTTKLILGTNTTPPNQTSANTTHLSQPGQRHTDPRTSSTTKRPKDSPHQPAYHNPGPHGNSARTRYQDTHTTTTATRDSHSGGTRPKHLHHRQPNLQLSIPAPQQQAHHQPATKHHSMRPHINKLQATHTTTTINMNFSNNQRHSTKPPRQPRSATTKHHQPHSHNQRQRGTRRGTATTPRQPQHTHRTKYNSEVPTTPNPRTPAHPTPPGYSDKTPPLATPTTSMKPRTAPSGNDQTNHT